MWARFVALAARRRALAAIGTGITLSALATSQTAWAKPKDVPNYLMPYYLTSLKKRFNRFARERDADGAKCMSPADFVRSVLCLGRTAAVPHAALKDLSKLFKLVDIDGDGLLSFSEYSLFMLFLTTNRERLQLAFQMFDTDERGGLTKTEFRELCEACSTDSTISINVEGGLSEYLFGQNATDRLKYEEFMAFVHSIRETVWRAEFKQHDPQESGFISAEAFARLITQGMLGSHLPFYIVDNMRKLRKREDSAEPLVPLTVWLNFNTIAVHERDVTPLMNYFTARRSMTKRDFLNIVRTACPGGFGDSSLEHEVDLIYAIFDRDGNGTLEIDEFAALARSRDRYNSIGRKKGGEEKPIFSLFASCVMEAAREKDRWL